MSTWLAFAGLVIVRRVGYHLGDGADAKTYLGSCGFVNFDHHLVGVAVDTGNGPTNAADGDHAVILLHAVEQRLLGFAFGGFGPNNDEIEQGTQREDEHPRLYGTGGHLVLSQ